MPHINTHHCNVILSSSRLHLLSACCFTRKATTCTRHTWMEVAENKFQKLMLVLQKLMVVRWTMHIHSVSTWTRRGYAGLCDVNWIIFYICQYYINRSARNSFIFVEQKCAKPKKIILAHFHETQTNTHARTHTNSYTNTQTHKHTHTHPWYLYRLKA